YPRLRRTVSLLLVEVRAPGGRDHSDHGAQNPVVVQARNSIQRSLQLARLLGTALLTILALRRVEAKLEEPYQAARDLGVRRERLLDVLDRERRSDLPEVHADRAQNDNAARVEPR